MRRLTPFPNGSDHALFPSVPCRPPQGSMRGSRGYPSHLSCFYVLAVPLRLTARLGNSLCSRPLRANSHLENRESRNSLEVSQSCGLKKRPLVQQTSSGPAATCAADLFGPSSHLENRERVAPAEPTVSGGLRNFTRRLRLSSSRWVGQASSTGLPEAFTRPAALGRPGRLDFVYKQPEAFTGKVNRPSFETLSQSHELLAVSFPPLCSGI